MPRNPPILLLVHGLGSSARAFRRLVPELPAGWSATAIDLPGYGSRTGEPGEVSIGAMAERLLPAVRDAHATGRPVVACGHSMGGCVAVELGDRAPELVAAVVAIAAPLTVEGRRTAATGSEGLIRRPGIGRIAWHLAPRRALRRGLRSAFAPGFAVPELFAADLARCSWRTFTTSTAAIDAWLAEQPMAFRLAEPRVPTVYLHGPQDLRLDPRRSGRAPRDRADPHRHRRGRRAHADLGAASGVRGLARERARPARIGRRAGLSTVQLRCDAHGAPVI
ncbi:MAG: alpha/beta fold hydrolase [Patulibacter minatonensis]